MKKILSLLVFVPLMVVAQTTTENYIKTKTYKVATATTITTPDITQASQNITYFDGLGRPIQQVAYQQSGTGTDVVTPIEYDAFGRQAKDYLPYATTTVASLDYKPNALSDVLGYYATATANHETTTNPYSEKLLESSPLNRVLKQAAPGNNWKLWAGHEIKLDYQTNTVADKVILYNCTASWNPTSGLYTIPTNLIIQYYDPSTLYKTITYDENTFANPTETLGSTIEFKDKEGRVVLKRKYNYQEALDQREDGKMERLDTYYVYDQFGNLTFVIPPAAETTYTIWAHEPGEEPYTSEVVLTNIDSSLLSAFCYQYKYDSRNRLVEKKLPGKQWEFIVYDKLDRVVATGPALSPFTDSPVGEVGWMITKYDVFNRPVYTGWESSTTVTSEGRTAKQNTMNGLTAFSENKVTTATTIDAITGVVYYTNTVLPTTFKLLTVNYYDNYAFFAFSPAISYAAPVAYNNTTLKPKGLPTGSWTRVLTTLASASAEKSSILYDVKARPVRTFSTNYLGGYTRIDNSYTFSGQLLSTITRHKRLSSSTELYVKDTYTYTPQDRLASHTHQIGTTGTPQLLASNSYDELGQLISKNVGGIVPPSGVGGLQKVDYSYNIRGWLKGINDTANLSQSSDPQDLFAFKISYDTPLNYQPLYNGNISATYWRTKNDNTLRKYSYVYDNLNRLKDAMFIKSGSAQSQGNYRETLSYDKNGNIQTLYRTGLFDYADYEIPIDDLYYGYNGNQLNYVSDYSNVNSGFKDTNKTAIDFSYDANGNMITDANKGITSITYNHLNLPTNITFQIAADNPNISYLYNANGVKLQKIVNTAGRYPSVTTTDYLGGFQYSMVIYRSVKTGMFVTTPVSLQFFPIAEGYVTKTSTTYGYVFNYTDHLGNVRLSYQDKNKDATITSDEIIEENNYYPFGMKHEGYNTTGTPPDYKYKYNGKELQDELGLNIYDYGARNYDPALGRWMNVDPLAEKMRRYSTYNYAFDNPLRFTDPDGMEPNDWIKNLTTGQVEWRAEVTSTTTTPEGYEYKGKEYNGISIRTYEATSTATSAGLDIQVNYNGSEASADIDFMQTVTTNMPAKGATSPYNDPQPSDDSKPFYYTDSEKPSYSDKLGKDLIFIDSPVRPNSKEGTTWSGELSVTKKSDGVHSIAETLNYGFEIKRGNAVLTPIIVQPASDFQKTTLGNYNKTLKKE